jgi:hypothetical protein
VLQTPRLAAGVANCDLFRPMRGAIMRGPRDPKRPDANDTDEQAYQAEVEAALERGDPVGAGRQVARGGPEQADVDGDTTDGEFGPGSD